MRIYYRGYIIDQGTSSIDYTGSRLHRVDSTGSGDSTGPGDYTGFGDSAWFGDCTVFGRRPVRTELAAHSNPQQAMKWIDGEVRRSLVSGHGWP